MGVFLHDKKSPSPVVSEGINDRQWVVEIDIPMNQRRPIGGRPGSFETEKPLSKQQEIQLTRLAQKSKATNIFFNFRKTRRAWTFSGEFNDQAMAGQFKKDAGKFMSKTNLRFVIDVDELF